MHATVVQNAAAITMCGFRYPGRRYDGRPDGIHTMVRDQLRKDQDGLRVVTAICKETLTLKP
jgi:hypothetical protein